MAVSTAELIEAREATAELLDALGLDAYLFEVEPGQAALWTVKVECPVDGGWETVTLSASREALLGRDADPNLRRELAQQWRERLLECKSRPPR